MNLKKDIIDEIDRRIYLKRADFMSVLFNETILYSDRIKTLIKISKEITVLTSTINTVEVLLKSKEENGNIS